MKTIRYLEIFEPDSVDPEVETKMLLKKKVRDKNEGKDILSEEITKLGGLSKVGKKRIHICKHDDNNPRDNLPCTVEELT